MMKTSYHLAPGTIIEDAAHSFAVVGETHDCHQLECIETGESMAVPFQTMARELQAKNLVVKKRKIDDTVLHALGQQYAHVQCMPKEQQALARLNYSVARAVLELEQQLQAMPGRKVKRLSHRALDRADIRQQLATLATAKFGERVSAAPTGGRQGTANLLYRGRTLRKYADLLSGAPKDVDPHIFMVTRDHEKGNRKARIPPDVQNLIYKAWREVGFDLRGPAVARVHDAVADKLHEINKMRMASGYFPLPTPSAKTIRNYGYRVGTPLDHKLGRNGLADTRNQHGGGSTDIRALRVGELIEIDECNLSIIARFQAMNLWETLAPETKKEVKKHTSKMRMHLVVAIDVATRMPLGWTLTDQPSAEATLSVLRMATRSKERERARYGCRNEAMPAIGIGSVKTDNGPGLRNTQVLAALGAIGARSHVVRAKNSTDKPHIERLFGTLESELLKLLPGYTGRKPNDLPGYDAMGAGILTQEELYALVSRFYIDTYPSSEHHGTGMFGRRPLDVLNEVMDSYRAVVCIPDDMRRMSLGVSKEVVPTDEGARFMKGLHYHSQELAVARDKFRAARKVTIFVDPDDLTEATVCMPDQPEPITVFLQSTAYVDLTLAEYQAEVTRLRRIDPRRHALHVDTVVESRNAMRRMVGEIEKTRKHPQAKSTIAELARQKAIVQGGPREPAQTLPDTWQADSVIDLCGDVPGRHEIAPVEDALEHDGSMHASSLAPETTTPKRTPAKAENKGSPKADNQVIGKARTIRTLEE